MVKERDPVVDIESTGSECEEDPRNESVTGSKSTKNLPGSLVGTLSFEGSDEGENSSNSNRNSVKTSDGGYNDIESLVNNKFEGEKGEHMPLIERTQTKEKHKTRNSKKAPKPPRPRKGPSLNTTDLQLVREISELVMKKRARVDRLKAMKKMRAARSSSPSSSNISLFAMVVTVLFFIVIIFQGFRSGKSSTLSFHESPEPSSVRTSGLVSGQFDSKPPVTTQKIRGISYLNK